MQDSDFQTLSPLFYWAGIFIACFSAFLIAGKRKKIMADYLLAAWFLIIGIHLVFFVLFFTGSYVRFPYFLGYEVLLPFIHGPMLYLYVLSVTGKRPGKKIWVLHSIPVFIVFLILSQLLILSPWDRLVIYQNGASEYKIVSTILKYLMIFSGVFYIGLSISAMRNYKKGLSDQYSNTEKMNMNWIYYLIIGMALIWIAVIVRNDILIFTIVVLFILVAAYFGISRVGILNLAAGSEGSEGKPVNDGVSGITKYQKTSPGDDVIQDIYERLMHRMEQGKLYTDPELNLNYVAQLLDVHPNILSQTINTMEQKNFYDYINRQRIEEFKRIACLPENQKFTILSLAFESGFNSKTSFNRNFKKYMNCSPREFLRSQSIDME
ncbi:helix-turn-helix domain-containing protein [Chryseobacterium arthrosphaerae]|uniref:helix-turn-helix domain-containing protein n=1 Tax=Chryseobacterium arthrosphaerae TaxID=651561 RepID=UPI0023E2B4FD|nr:helix-turn-helix domain-containing protein [Chryseobacterium arthrosphaerae]WES96761.1 helix-turn-helix domain-containing protein [Chryseobacterium arthrosphaerae]